MSTDKAFARKGLIWGVSGKLLNALLKFFSVPLLLTHFGEQQYGLIALAISINFYLKIMELGFNTGNVRFLSHWLAKGNNDSIVKLVQSSLFFYGVIGSINLIILLILSVFSKQIFSLDETSDQIFQKLILILSVTAFFSWSFAVTSHILRAYKRIDYDERLQILSNVIIFVGVLLTVFLNLTIVQYFMIYAFGLLLPFPLRVYKIRKLNESISFIPKWNSKVFREVFRYSLGIFSMGFFQMSVQNLRPIILGIQSPISSVAEFKIIEQIAMVIILLAGSFLGVLLPFATKFKAENNLEAQKKLAFDVTRYLSVFLVLLVFGLITISDPLIKVYVGEKYSHLSIWLNIWALTLLGMHNSSISSLILAGSDIRTITLFTAISSTLSVITAWFLAPVYEVGGVVLAYSMYVVLQILFYYTYYIPYKMKFNSARIFVRSFLFPLCVGIISYGMVYLLMDKFSFNNYYLIITVSGVSFTTIYIGITLLTTFRIREIKSLLK